MPSSLVIGTSASPIYSSSATLVLVVAFIALKIGIVAPISTMSGPSSSFWTALDEVGVIILGIEWILAMSDRAKVRKNNLGSGKTFGGMEFGGSRLVQAVNEVVIAWSRSTYIGWQAWESWNLTALARHLADHYNFFYSVFINVFKEGDFWTFGLRTVLFPWSKLFMKNELIPRGAIVEGPH